MGNGVLGGVGAGIAQLLPQVSTAAAGAEKRRSTDDDNPSSKAEETSEQQVSREAFSTGKKLDVSA